MPRHLLVIGTGHDDDFNCLDLRSRNSETGDYRICYWAPANEETPIASGFREYLQDLVLYLEQPR